MRNITTKVPKIPDDYLELIRRFPLRPIRTESEYERAGRVYIELMARADKGLTEGELDYVQVLGRLIGDYDDVHSILHRKESTPIQRLKFLMEENELNTVDLGKLVGGSGQASLILNGKRQLSKANIRVLAERFKVSPALFL